MMTNRRPLADVVPRLILPAALLLPERKPKEVLVPGPGCSKCKETYRVVERVIAENHVDVKLSKIEDIAEMMS